MPGSCRASSGSSTCSSNAGSAESSFGQYQNLKRIRELEAEVRTLEAALAEIKRYEAPCGDFQRIGRYRRARQEAEARRQALGRGGRRGERTLAEAETGRLALVRRKGAPGLALILGVHSIREIGRAHG